MNEEGQKKLFIKYVVTNLVLLSQAAASILMIVAVSNMDPTLATALFHATHGIKLQFAVTIMFAIILTLISIELLYIINALTDNSYQYLDTRLSEVSLFIICVFIPLSSVFLLSKLVSAIFVSHVVTPVLVASFVLFLIPIALLTPNIINLTFPSIGYALAMIGGCAAIATFLVSLIPCGIALCSAALVLYGAVMAVVATIEGTAYIASTACNLSGYEIVTDPTPKEYFKTTNTMMKKLSASIERTPTALGKIADNMATIFDTNRTTQPNTRRKDPPIILRT